MQVTETLNQGLKRELKLVVGAADLSKDYDSRVKEVAIHTFEASYNIIGKYLEAWTPRTRETADHSFGLDLAAFYIDWDNIIVNFTQNGFAARTNVTGGATSRGGELTLTARPTRGFVATAALAYQRARLSEASTVLRAAKGERLPGVPKFTASVNADYEWDMGAVRPSLGASLRFVDDRRSSFNAATSVPQYRLPAYEAVDLRAGLTFGHVKAQIYARNLFDVKGQLNTRFTSPAAGPITLSILPPRTVGASVTVDF